MNPLEDHLEVRHGIAGRQLHDPFRRARPGRRVSSPRTRGSTATTPNWACCTRTSSTAWTPRTAATITTTCSALPIGSRPRRGRHRDLRRTGPESACRLHAVSDASVGHGCHGHVQRSGVGQGAQEEPAARSYRMAADARFADRDADGTAHGHVECACTSVKALADVFPNSKSLNLIARRAENGKQQGHDRGDRIAE
jgi:hypothetical protein